MRPKFQSKQSVIINAPLEKVWDFTQDLSCIPDYHPRVNKVDLISGKRFREVGVSYQCNLSDGKNSCIEKDNEIVPMEKIVTILPSDTMGLTKLLPDYERGRADRLYYQIKVIMTKHLITFLQGPRPSLRIAE